MKKRTLVVTSIFMLSVTIILLNPAYAIMPEISVGITGALDDERVYTRETSMGTAMYRPALVSADAPANRLVAPGGFPDGVANLFLTGPGGSSFCTGHLMAETGFHVMTAAHCVTDLATGAFNLISGTATFEGDGGNEVFNINIAGSASNPGWNGEAQDLLCGNDVAILELDTIPTADIQDYFMDTTPGDDNTIGALRSLFGYGTAGLQLQQFFDNLKRGGGNSYDATQDFLQLVSGNTLCTSGFVPGGILSYDFDNGLAANDAYGAVNGFPFPHLGLGNDIEANIGPGDSGGPGYTGTVVTGIHSFGLTFSNLPSDLTVNVLDSSIGEFAGDTRVSNIAAWAQSHLDTRACPQGFTGVPPNCVPITPIVGGELIPLDTSALLLAGTQMNAAWMIPAIVSAIGIAIVIARKF